MPPLFCPQLCPTSPPLSHQRYPNASLSHIAHWNTTPGHIRVSHTLQPACASLPAEFFPYRLYAARRAPNETASNLLDINSQAGLNQIAPFGFMHNHAPLTKFARRAEARPAKVSAQQKATEPTPKRPAQRPDNAAKARHLVAKNTVVCEHKCTVFAHNRLI